MRANRGRVAAARALLDVEEGAFAEDALNHHLGDSTERQLAWFLCLGVLRHRSHIDAALRPFLKQPLAALDAEVRTALRLGAYEILFARTKPHAAVSQGVEVVAALGKFRAKGLVNAVLRRVVEPNQMQRAERLNHPGWLIARWDERYGTERVDAWCQANNEPPALMVVATDETLPDQWRSAGLDVTPASAAGEPVTDAWCIAGLRGAVTGLAGWEEGTVWVQDAMATAIADFCGDVDGRSVLDACAAPGGKTMRLLSRGAQVVAADRSEKRLERVAENLDRTGLKVVALTRHDWTDGPLPDGPTFDVVLVDAPCSALGTIRRSPEVRWRRQEMDLEGAAATQRTILDAAATHVAPGGTLVYAVCSPEPEEGEAVVAHFLETVPGFRLDASLDSAPPANGEDAHRAFRLIRQE